MRVIEVQLFQYDELSEPAKYKARYWYTGGMFDYDWWSFTYEDAENIGLRIEAFDCYRGTIEGKLLDSVSVVCKKIRAQHGKSCLTYRLAKSVDLRKVIDEDTADEFRRALLAAYLSMLNEEVAHMESRKSIEENIRANEYEFTADGKRS